MQMKILGVEFDFDIHNVDHAEAFEAAIDQLSESEKSIKEAASGGKMSQVNRAVIGMFKQFFITATGVDVIGDCRNAASASGAYYDFCEEVGKSKGQLLAKYDARRVR